MFYLSYLRSELLRRKGRTILTLLGLSIGVALAAAIGAFGPSLTASATTGNGQDAFGLGTLVRTVSQNVPLTAPLAVSVLLVGFGIALLGGLLAAARLRPADALRTVE